LSTASRPSADGGARAVDFFEALDDIALLLQPRDLFLGHIRIDDDATFGFPIADDHHAQLLR